MLVEHGHSKNRAVCIHVQRFHDSLVILLLTYGHKTRRVLKGINHEERRMDKHYLGSTGGVTWRDRWMKYGKRVGCRWKHVFGKGTSNTMTWFGHVKQLQHETLTKKNYQRGSGKEKRKQIEDEVEVYDRTGQPEKRGYC